MQKFLQCFGFALLCLFLSINVHAQNTNCEPPSALTANSVDTNKIILNWTAPIAAIGAYYVVEYSELPTTATSLNSIVAQTNSYTMTGLKKCKEYAVRVRTMCSSTSMSDWTPVQIITTKCVAVKPAVCSPTSFSNFSIDSTIIKVGWIAVTGNNYEIQYTTAPASTTSIWTNISTASNPALMPNLKKCTEYVVRIKTKCANGLASDWSYKSIKTSGCVQVLPCTIPSCTSSADSTSIKVGWTAITGNIYELQYTAAPANSASVWISVATSSNPAIISGLTKCKNYSFRLRTKCKSGLTSNWVYKNIKTTGCGVTIPCPTLSTVSITADSVLAKITWATSPVGGSVEIEYTPSPAIATSVWATVSSSTSPTAINNLKKCTEYTVRIRTKCTNGTLGTWTYRVFKTNCNIVEYCHAPYFTNIIPDSTNIKISLGTVKTGTSIEMQYTTTPVSISSVWVNVPATSSPITILGLKKCTEYAIRAKAKCADGGISDWITQTAKTTGCNFTTCLAPYISSASADSTSVKVSWTYGMPNTTVEFQYAPTPITATSVWTTVPVTTSNFFITGLKKCTEYELRIRTKCGEGYFSTWYPRIIKTTGCGTTTPILCDLTPVLTAVPSTESMILGWVMTAGATYDLSYTQGAVTNTSTTVAWTSIPTTTNPYSLKGLLKCSDYTFRFRVKCASGLYTKYVYKIVKTTGCISTCPKPTDVKVVGDSTSAKITWVGPTDVGYVVEHTPLPVTVTSVWTPSVGQSAVLTIKNLKSCTEYAFRIRTVCSPTSFSDWVVVNAKTTNCITPTPCVKPTYLSSQPIAGGVVLKWQGTSPNYEIRYSKKTAGTVIWTTLSNINTNNYTLANMEACVFYAWQVRAKCQDGTFSEWTTSSVFETGGCNNRMAKMLSVYPNPGTYLNVDYTILDGGNIDISIMNLQGNEVGKYNLGKRETGTHHFDVENMNIPAGVYIISISIDGKKKEVQRWVKTTN